MKIELDVTDIIKAFKNMNTDEKDLFANAIKTDETIMKAINEEIKRKMQSEKSKTFEFFINRYGKKIEMPQDEAQGKEIEGITINLPG